MLTGSPTMQEGSSEFCACLQSSGQMPVCFPLLLLQERRWPLPADLKPTGITTADAAFSLIRRNAAFMAALSQPVPGCHAHNMHPAVLPVRDCSHTQVQGLPGTG